MQFIGKPKPSLLPPLPKKDCFLKLCTPTCLKWCDGFFPPTSPPPPLTFPDDKSQNSPTFSPLVIAIIGILASAFLLVSYYAIISKYCGNSSDSRRNRDPPNNNEETMEEDFNGSFRHEPNQHEPWLITTQGLDEALIKTITLVKYKKGDGLVGSSDCSVCLGEFLEDDTLRLLPKCSHAFHVACIDTWLRSHSNCPLCRANIISNFVTTNQPPNITLNNPSLVVDNDHDLNINVVQENQGESEEISSSEEGRQMGISGENLPKTSNAQFRALSDLGVRGYIGRDPMRRSISMDHFRYETRVSSDVLRYNNHGEEECVVKICQFHDQALKMADNGESSKFGVCNSSSSSSSSRSGVLQCVMSSVAMKRSFSSGRFLFSKHGRGRNAVIPL